MSNIIKIVIVITIANLIDIVILLAHVYYCLIKKSLAT
jgi:hypothetical protein